MPFDLSFDEHKFIEVVARGFIISSDIPLLLIRFGRDLWPVHSEDSDLWLTHAVVSLSVPETPAAVSPNSPASSS